MFDFRFCFFLAFVFSLCKCVVLEAATLVCGESGCGQGCMACLCTCGGSGDKQMISRRRQLGKLEGLAFL